MVAVEIILIIIGVVFLIGSFFVTEKLSQKDLDHITMMSETDLQHIVDKQLKEANVQIETAIEDIIDESLEITKRGLEKETNKKIMAVSEYSDTVIEQINKTHNEIMFLYSMLNDKHTETADLVQDMQKYAKQIREFDVDAAIAKLDTATSALVTTDTPAEKKEAEGVSGGNIESFAVEQVEQLESTDRLDGLNKNEKILTLYQEGMTEVEIAKNLDCGLGEVRLVLGLYREA